MKRHIKKQEQCKKVEIISFRHISYDYSSYLNFMLMNVKQQLAHQRADLAIVEFLKELVS